MATVPTQIRIDEQLKKQSTELFNRSHAGSKNIEQRPFYKKVSDI